MTDREKVIKGLKCHTDLAKCDCEDCPYYGEDECYLHLQKDALELLKDQPDIVHCGECKNADHWYKDKSLCFLWDDTGIDVFKDGFCNYGKKKEAQG